MWHSSPGKPQESFTLDSSVLANNGTVINRSILCRVSVCVCTWVHACVCVHVYTQSCTTGKLHTTGLHLYMFEYIQDMLSYDQINPLTPCRELSQFQTTPAQKSVRCTLNHVTSWINGNNMYCHSSHWCNLRPLHLQLPPQTVHTLNTNVTHTLAS